MLGRNYKTVYADGSSRQSFYNNKGQLTNQVDHDGVINIYLYSASGEVEYTVTDLNTNNVVDWDTDRIRHSIHSVVNTNGAIVRQTLTYAWSTNGSTNSNLISATLSSVDGLRSWSANFGRTNHTGTFYAGSGNRYVTNYAPDGALTLSYFQHGQLKTGVDPMCRGASDERLPPGYLGGASVILFSMNRSAEHGSAWAASSNRAEPCPALRPAFRVTNREPRRLVDSLPGPLAPESQRETGGAESSECVSCCNLH